MSFSSFLQLLFIWQPCLNAFQVQWSDARCSPMISANPSQDLPLAIEAFYGPQFD